MIGRCFGGSCISSTLMHRCHQMARHGKPRKSDALSLNAGVAAPLRPATALAARVAEQMVSRYRLPDGYPWTRLGNTSDWSADPPQIGASEFVIPKDAAFELTEKVDTAAYRHGSASAYTPPH
jgi:hypothetical protein